MKRLRFALPFLFAASLAAQSAETIIYRALLSNNNEVPVVANVGNGTATVWMHVVRDASGAIVSGSVDANVAYQLGAASTFTGMHIHSGNSTVSGPVVVPFAIARTDVTTAAGNLPPVQTQFPTTATTLDTIKGIMADPSQYYFNVHTTANGGGIMRGQLVRAEAIVRVAVLRGENEVPAITGAPWSGTGSIITLITRNPGGAITSAYAIFDAKYTGFPDDTAFTGMHIHLGRAGANGGVTIDSGMRGPIPVAAGGVGTLHFEAEAVLTRAGAMESLNALVSDPSLVYYNVHTTARTGGAMRGQVLRTDTTNFPITLTGAQENPPVTGVNPAQGNITVFTARNADSTVAAGVVVFDGNVRFPSGQNLTGMHIHDALTGTNGPVSIDAALNSSPVLIADGTGNILRIVTVGSGQALVSLNDVLINPEKHYWNIHTSANPGGGVRGQMGAAVTAAPAITTIQNGALAASQTALAPGGLFSIFGTNLAKVAGNTQGFNNPALPTSLNGVSVTVGGKAAPLLYVAPDQINAQVPVEATSGQAVVVTGANGVSTSVNTLGGKYAPAVFSDAVGGIVFKVRDGSLVRPGNPAVAGDSLVVYATGLGLTEPALAAGQLTPRDVWYVTEPVSARIGGVAAAVTSSVAAPGFAGVYQVTLTVPAGIAAGTAKLQINAPFPALANFGAPNYSASNSVDIAVK